MYKLYEKKELLFAILWIAAYCVIIGTLKGSFDYDSIYLLLTLIVFAAGITAFVKVTWKKNTDLPDGQRI